ncbi:MAG: tail fiber domain-containing protein [Crocinitomicaceae bacterium]
MKNLFKFAFWVSLGLAPTTNQLFAQTNTNLGNSSGNGGSGSSNTFVGYAAGQSNTTGSNNSFFGSSSGQSNTTGGKNVFLGWRSGEKNINGINNLFLGANAGRFNLSGSQNTILGPGAGTSNETGLQNTMVGYLAGRNNQSGDNNVYMGASAGFNNQGSNNVFIGNQAGFNESGSNTLYIDNSSTSNPLIYGDFTTNDVAVNGALQVTNGINSTTLELTGQGGVNLSIFSENVSTCSDERWHIGFPVQGSCAAGGGSVTAPFMTFRHTSGPSTINLGIGQTTPQEKLDVNGNVRAMDLFLFSDKRLKRDIKPIGNASEILSKIDGVTYDFRDEFRKEGLDLPEGQQIGFIAQDLQKVIPEMVREDEEGYLSVSYRSLIPVLVEGHKELKAENDDLKASLEEAQETNRKLEQEIESIKSMISGLTEKLPTTTVQLEEVKEATLLQNAPNPFTESTRIGYELPEDCDEAQLLITDAKGMTIKSIGNLETGKGNIVLQANSLAPGSYRYTLICQGRTLDSKTMVIVR